MATDGGCVPLGGGSVPVAETSTVQVFFNTDAGCSGWTVVEGGERKKEASLYGKGFKGVSLWGGFGSGKTTNKTTRLHPKPVSWCPREESNLWPTV